MKVGPNLSVRQDQPASSFQSAGANHKKLVKLEGFEVGPPQTTHIINVGVRV
jgi:hypothetical protein